MTFRTLDLNLLRVFDAVMEERHVTRAAERLAMSQPAVSHALRRLRRTLGDELFVARPTGVVPTARAQVLWPTVRDALDSLRRVIGADGFDPLADPHPFTVAMADATAAVVMPHLAQAWASSAARATLGAVGMDTRDPRPLLEQGSADVAVGFFPEVERELAGDGDAGSARHERLYSCRYVAVMRAGHALARRESLTLDDYCAAQHLRVNFAGRRHGYVDEALMRIGRQRSVVMAVEHFATAASTVAACDLLTVLPLSYADAADRGGGALVTRDLPLELPAIEVGMLWHRRHEHDAAHRWLRAMLRGVAQAVASGRKAAERPAQRPASSATEEPPAAVARDRTAPVAIA